MYLVNQKKNQKSIGIVSMKKWFNFIINLFKSKAEALSLDEQFCLEINDCFYLFNRLQFSVKDIDPLTRVKIHFNSFYPTIDQYINRLNDLTVLIKDNAVVDRELLPISKLEVSLHAFLLTKDCFYVNDVEVLNHFKDSVGLFCKSLLINESIENEIYFITNVRLCRSLIMNLTEIGHQLSTEFSS